MMRGAIEGYVRQVEERLPSGCAVRADLVAELRDGLDDAATAHRRAGLDARQAELRAVREAGPAEEVAASYRAELVAAQGQRTAALIGLSLPAVVLAWTAMWRFGGGAMAAGEWPESGFVLVLARVVDWAAVAGGAFALVGLAVLVLSARRGRDASWVVRAVAVTGGAFLLAHVAADVLMNVLLLGGGFDWRTMFLGPAGIMGSLSMVVMWLQLRSLWRTVRLSFG